MDQYNWDDIDPLSIEESSTPQLCHILYSDEYKETMGYLRKMMLIREYSERALYITERAISQVAAHYTVWKYRFDIITHLQKDVLRELEWCDDILLNNQKNYQIWHYRQLLIQHYESIGNKFSANLETPLIETMLVEDNKNYHVWSYKKWLVEHFKLYNDERELKFTDKMLSIDVRNNSAWNYRYFIITNLEKFDLQLELKYVGNAIMIAPQNASPWNYLQGLYKHFNISLLELEPFVMNFASLEDDDVEEIIQSTFLFEILLKIYILKNENEKSIKIYKLLGERYDPIRINYWNYLISKCIV